VVHKTASAHVIGAHIFCGNHTASLIYCFITKNIFGTDAAHVTMRILLSRFQLKKGIMMKSKFLNSLILAALAVPGVAMAADAPAAAPAPTLSSVLDASGVSLSGDMDFSYSRLSGTGVFKGGINDRVFDYAHNSFSLQAIDLTVAKLPAEGYGGLVDLTMGKDASTIASAGTGYTNQTFDITQAFVQYATGNWTTIAGKFVTMSGQEVIKTTGDTNLSRSILFGYAIPFSHTGVRATYKVSDAVSLTGGVNNGWDQATDANSQKTIELGAMLNPAKSFALSAMVYSGAEPGAAGTGTRNLLDLVGTFTVTDSLNFVLNYDYGSQENAVAAGAKAKWNGLAGYANYQINDLWRVSARAETFKDTDGYRTGVNLNTGGQKWKEVTLTVGYAPTKSTELRGEVRRDTSDQAAFGYSDGIARKAQSSLGLEAVYKF
jgi:Putative beta-barrel porin-2, OmpL-like. bbp2